MCKGDSIMASRVKNLSTTIQPQQKSSSSPSSSSREANTTKATEDKESYARKRSKHNESRRTSRHRSTKQQNDSGDCPPKQCNDVGERKRSNSKERSKTKSSSSGRQKSRERSRGRREREDDITNSKKGSETRTTSTIDCRHRSREKSRGRQEKDVAIVSREQSEIRPSHDHRQSSRERNQERIYKNATRHSSRERSGNTKSSSYPGRRRHNSSRERSSGSGDRRSHSTDRRRREKSKERSSPRSDDLAAGSRKQNNGQCRERNKRPEALTVVLPSQATKNSSNVILAFDSADEQEREANTYAKTGIDVIPSNVKSKSQQDQRRQKITRRKSISKSKGILKKEKHSKIIKVEEKNDMFQELSSMLPQRNTAYPSSAMLKDGRIAVSSTNTEQQDKESPLSEEDIQQLHIRGLARITRSQVPQQNEFQQSNHTPKQDVVAETQDEMLQSPLPSVGAKKPRRQQQDRAKHKNEDFSCVTFTPINDWGKDGSDSGTKLQRRLLSVKVDSIEFAIPKKFPVPSVVCLFRRNEASSIVEEASVNSEITFRQPSSLMPLNEPRIRRCKSLEVNLSNRLSGTSKKRTPVDRFRKIKYIRKSDIQGN